MATVGFAGFSLELSSDELAALRARVRRNPLYHGPCLIIDRQTGLALDATPDAAHRSRPTLWPPHAAPWQQWRLRPAGGGRVNIVSEMGGGLELTTDAEPGEKSWVWLERRKKSKDQMWRLKPSEDSTAYIVQTPSSKLALDTGQNAQPGWEPILYWTHEEPWQQWLVVRIPLV